MIGRNEEVNVSQGIASSFSCQNNCCGPTDLNARMNPSTASMPINSNAYPFVSQCQSYTCDASSNYQYYWTNWTSAATYNWSSDNSSVASVSSTYVGNNAQVTTGSTGGTANISGSIDYDKNGLVWDPCARVYCCGVIATYTSTSNPPGQLQVNCGDTRDGLRTEYFPQNYGADFIPGCGEFTFGNSGDQITTHFTFGELNVRDIASNEYPNWAILRNYFLTAIENTRSNYNAALNVSPPGSAYRSPFINAILNPPGATNSRHIHGDAVDFASDSNTWDAIANAATNAGATCVESRQATFPGHVHASWGPSGTC